MKPNSPNTRREVSTKHGRWLQIETKLRKAKDRLVMAGTIVRQNGSSFPERWVCRYREKVGGRKVNRAVYLGDEEFANRARTLIERWRAEAVSPEDRRRQKLLCHWSLTASALGYSRRGRRRVRAAALNSFGDWRAELQLTHDIVDEGSHLRVGKSPGRPPRSGLW